MSPAQPISFQPIGTPEPGSLGASSAPAPVAAGSGNQPQGPTPAEFERRLTQLERQLQSANDKATAAAKNQEKVKADLDGMRRFVELQKQSGVQITPEQERQMQQQVINQAFSQVEQPQAVSSTQNASQQSAPDAMPQAPDPYEAINVAAQAMVDEGGVNIDPNDIRLIRTSPGAFLHSLSDVIAQEKKRQAASPQARIPPTNSGNAASLQQQYQIELAKITRGPAGSIARVELTKKYRALGLPE